MRKNSYNMQFAFMLNRFSQKMNKRLNRVFKFRLNTYDYITLGFAKKGQFTNKKGNGKLS